MSSSVPSLPVTGPQSSSSADSRDANAPVALAADTIASNPKPVAHSLSMHDADIYASTAGTVKSHPAGQCGTATVELHSRASYSPTELGNAAAKDEDTSFQIHPEMLNPPQAEVHSGVGVLDKTIKIIDALESGPATLGQLVEITGLARPTAHRLAIALEKHRFVLRDVHGRFVLGPRFAELATAAGEDRLLTAANPVLQTLLERTGESAQIFRRQGDQRVCIAAVERSSGLHDSIPVGALLSMRAGSAAQILLAWEEPERLHEGLRHAKFTASTLAAVRRRGWSDSANEREQGICSVSAPIRNASNQVIAAISISGPAGRMGLTPGKRYAPYVMAGGRYLSQALRKASAGR